MQSPHEELTQQTRASFRSRYAALSPIVAASAAHLLASFAGYAWALLSCAVLPTGVQLLQLSFQHLTAGARRDDAGHGDGGPTSAY